MAMRLICLIVFHAVITSTAAANVFGPAQPLTPLAPRSYTTSRQNPVVASNGEVTLVTWSQGDVYGALYRSDFEPTDAFPIAPTWVNDDNPAVIAHRDGFVVAWSSRLGLHATKISPDRDVRGILHQGDALGGEALSSAMASTSSGILFGWTTYDGTTAKLQLVLLHSDLQHVRIAGVIHGVPRNAQVAIAPASGGFLVAAAHDTGTRRKVAVYHLTADGSLLQRSETLEHTVRSSHSPTELAISSHGYGFLLGVSSPGTAAVIALDADGRVSGSPTSLSPVSPNHNGISIVWDEGHHVVATVGESAPASEETRIQLTVVDAAGRPLAGNPNASTGAIRPLNPRLVKDETGITLLFTEGVGHRELVAATVLPDLSVPAWREIVRTVGNQREPDSLFDGDHFVVTWVEGSHLLVAKFHRDGRAATAPVSTALADLSFTAPAAIARSDSGFVVAWSTRSGNVFARRLSDALETLDAPVFVGKGTLTDLVAADNSVLILWAAENQRQEATLLTDNGLLIRTELASAIEATSGQIYGSYGGRAIWTGRRYIAAWLERTSGPCFGRACGLVTRIRTMTLDRTGALVGGPNEIAPDGENIRLATSGSIAVLSYTSLVHERSGTMVVGLDEAAARTSAQVLLPLFQSEIVALGDLFLVTGRDPRTSGFPTTVFLSKSLQAVARSDDSFDEQMGEYPKTYALAASGSEAMIVYPFEIHMLPHAHDGATSRLALRVTKIPRRRINRDSGTR